MRKNIASVIDAFHAEEAYQEKTCRTDGTAVYSYALLIALRYGGHVYVLDATESPSRTTTAQIRAVMAALPAHRVRSGEALRRLSLWAYSRKDAPADA
jgi:hypothetical protein